MNVIRLMALAALAVLAAGPRAGAAEASPPAAPAAAPTAPAASPAAPAAAPSPSPAASATAPTASAPPPASASPSASPGGEAAPDLQTVLLELADRLSDEAERQHQVDQRMDVAVIRFLAIIEDLRSNDLFKQGHGPQSERVAQVLKVLGTRHVPDAAKYLEEARKQLQALRPNLASADKEIDIILAELRKILEGGSGVSDDLLRELEVLIQDEKRAHQTTRQWGAQLLQDPQEAEKPRREIATAQEQIARRTDRFMDRLRQSRDAESDPARHLGMQKAHEALDQAKVPKLMDSAAQDIEDRKPVSATKAQEDAIRAMEAAADHLRQKDLAADIQALKEFRDRIEKILKEEVALRETTEKVPEADFPREKNQLQVQQRAIEKETAAAIPDVPPAASPEVSSHLKNADGHMQQAEQQMAQTRQPQAVASQKEAEKSLQEAIKRLDQDIAAAEQAWQQQYQPTQSLADIAQKAMELAQKQQELKTETGQTQPQTLPQLQPAQSGLQQQAQALQQALPMPQFQQAAQAMQQAGQQLQQSQQQPAMQQQQQAIDALMSAVQALQQAQAAMDLASQQMQLMNQTAQAPMQGLPQLAPPQQSLQQQTQAAQFQQAAQAMQQAAQQLQQSQQQPAMQSQQAAISALMGQAAQAMGMQPGQQPGQQPGMGMTPGMVPGTMPAAQAMPVPAVDPMEMGVRDFGRGGAAGPDHARGADTWNPYGQRERDALLQKYARQLPPEYRELLGDYFEALSKESPAARLRRPAPAAPGASSEANP